tara:strand:- start:44 stop:757 length:714 start_codon:yes stop_codon:yes gene_type:complete
MLKKIFPNKILLISPNFINKLIILMIAVFFLGLIYSLFISPPDYIQGDSVRIMYVHVPSSFLALGCFAFLGIASIINIIFKIKFVSLMAKSLAPVGMLFTIISIVTGSLWGKPTWGIWWVWDARLTSMFVLLCFYLAYILSWKYISDFRRANTTSSIISIIGLFNLPIIKFSVDWWNTLHQTSSITLTSAPKIHITMLIPLMIMLLGMLIYLSVIFLIKYKTEIMKFKLEKNKNKSS